MVIEASEIVPQLWQGSRPLMGEYVAQAGFQVLVLCAREYQPPASNFPSVEVIHAPNDDDPRYYPFTLDSLKGAIEASGKVAKAYLDGKNILVTCQAGLNRSGFVMALALHRIFGWNGSLCIQRVRTRRGVRNDIAPLSNRDFTTVLRKLPSRPQPSEPGPSLLGEPSLQT